MRDIFDPAELPQKPNPNRMNIFNAFGLTKDGMWLPKGEQLIICFCGFTDGFRVFAEGDIAKVVTDHNKECPLLEGRDRSKV